MLEMNDRFVAACVSSQAEWNDSAANCVHFFKNLLFIYSMWQLFPSSQNPLPHSPGHCSCLTPIKLHTWRDVIYWIVIAHHNSGKYLIPTDTGSLLQAWMGFAFPSLWSLHISSYFGWYLHKLCLLLMFRKISLISPQTFDNQKFAWDVRSRLSLR